MLFQVDEDSTREGGYLSSKEHLNRVKIVCKIDNDKEGEKLMEKMQPHCNLKVLELMGDKSVMRMLSWGRGCKLVTYFPNLVTLRLFKVDIEHLMCLGNLRYLKVLTLESMTELEYIVDDISVAQGCILFSSLEQLEFTWLPKLKGWRKLVGDDGSTSMEALSFPRLKTLSILRCNRLESNLLCLVLERLYLKFFNEKL